MKHAGVDCTADQGNTFHAPYRESAAQTAAMRSCSYGCSRLTYMTSQESLSRSSIFWGFFFFLVFGWMCAAGLPVPAGANFGLSSSAGVPLSMFS